MVKTIISGIFCQHKKHVRLGISFTNQKYILRHRCWVEKDSISCQMRTNDILILCIIDHHAPNDKVFLRCFWVSFRVFIENVWFYFYKFENKSFYLVSNSQQINHYNLYYFFRMFPVVPKTPDVDIMVIMMKLININTDFGGIMIVVIVW